MKSLVRTMAAAVAAGIVFAAPLAAQQTGLTDAMLKSAALEVPRLVQILGVKPGMTVGDVGAGFGAWTVTLGKWIGPAGHVYATDIGQKQLAFLREFTAKEGLTNVTVIAGVQRSTGLPAGCCDAILIRDAYHHLNWPGEILLSIGTALKPGGRLAVIDFATRPNTEVPDGVPANRGGHGISPDLVVEEVNRAGLETVSVTPKWSPESQPGDLYLAVFRKAAN